MIPAAQIRGVPLMIVSNALNRSAGMSCAAGSASTKAVSAIDMTKGMNPISTSRLAISRP